MRPVLRSSLTVLAAGAMSAVVLLPTGGGHAAAGSTPATELISRRSRLSSTTTSSSTTSSSTTSTSTPTSSTSTSSTSTSTTSTSTTSTSVPAGGSLLWSAGMEGGNLNEWSASSGGGMYNSGTYTDVAAPVAARSGLQGLLATITTPNSPTSGVRAFRWKEARGNQSAYYSVWVRFPVQYTLTGDPNTGQFLNLFQFKTRTTDGSRVDPVWAMYATPTGDGRLYLRAGWGWGGTQLAGPYANSDVSGKWFEPTTKVPLPVNQWIHLEAFLRQSRDFGGQLTFWQDGVKILDLNNIRTSYDNCSYNSWCADNEWAVNLYSDGMSPNPAILHIDDAAISTGYIP